jgi:hypothetical protein
MKPIDRLLSYLELKQISAYAFERACEVSNGYLYKQQKGKGTIGSDILEKIRKVYSDLNLIWLISGEGEMLLGDDSRLVKEEHERYERAERLKSISANANLIEALSAGKKLRLNFDIDLSLVHPVAD